MSLSNMKHRKFLKRPSTTYEIGVFFPNEVKLFQEGEKQDTKYLSNTINGSSLYFLSEGCQACDLNPILKTIRKYQEFQHVIFYEGIEKLIIDKDFCPNTIIYSCNLESIEKQLNIKVVPYHLVLNRIGQVITAGVINNDIQIENHLSPLIRAVQQS